MQSLAAIHKESVRSYLFHALHKPTVAHRGARYISYFLTFIILANCAAVALETVPTIYNGHQDVFYWLEVLSTAIFAIEYAARIWVCVEQVKFSSPLLGRIKVTVRP